MVIYPPPDRTAGLDSLKRFKDDVREVREGFECGIKIAGYDDIKVDDVIEAYRDRAGAAHPYRRCVNAFLPSALGGVG